MVDVVNEPLHAPPPFKKALGGDGATGWDWVVTSFQWARQYCDSSVQLILNEYSVLQSNSVTDNFLKIIDTLKVRKLIDAIGIQGHSFELLNQSPSTIEYNLNRLAATGLPIYITEFDINLADDSLQLQNYKTYFPIFWENPGVKGITLWGYVYGSIWQTNAYLLNDRNAKRPAFTWLISSMNSPYRPKPVSPVNVTGTPRNPLLVWHPNDTIATTYRVQLSETSAFATCLLDTVVADTLLKIDSLAANLRVYWRVCALNNAGSSEYSIAVGFVTGEQLVSVPQSDAQPAQYTLFQNYPNPFNPTTTISYDIPNTAYVTLDIYDVLGRVVAHLVNSVQVAKRYSVQWNPSHLGSGVYFCRIQAARMDGSIDYNSVKKLIYMK
jgi:endo-1,4-beta-xylanase